MENTENENKTEILGVSKDAELEVNSNGGKQSKSFYAMHLIDPIFLSEIMQHDTIICHVASAMIGNSRVNIIKAVREFALIEKISKENVLLEIAKVLKEGAEKYKANNWRLIPQEEHLNHALVHYFAYLSGDTQDNHYGHFLCRMMMAYKIRSWGDEKFLERFEEGVCEKKDN